MGGEIGAAVGDAPELRVGSKAVILIGRSGAPDATCGRRSQLGHRDPSTPGGSARLARRRAITSRDMP
eukprot:2476498-Alexandrium_andersonii.AAC.1